jgi:hypothetical protein
MAKKKKKKTAKRSGHMPDKVIEKHARTLKSKHPRAAAIYRRVLG